MTKITLKTDKNVVFERPAKTRRFQTSAGMKNFALDSTHKGWGDARKRGEELHAAGWDVRRIAGAAINLRFLEYEGGKDKVTHIYARKSDTRDKKKAQKYRYEQVHAGVSGSRFQRSKKRYVAPVERKQTQIMERLDAKDREIISDAYRRGLAIEMIIGYVRDATGITVAASTAYAYCKRHGITRSKRNRRSDAGSEAIQLSTMNERDVRDAWRAGETWQQIQKRIREATGRKAGKSAIYAYMRKRGIRRR